MAINLKTSDGTIKAVLTEDEVLAILEAHAKKELQSGHQKVLGSDDTAGHVYVNTTDYSLVQRAGIQARPVAEGVYAEGEKHKVADAAHVHPIPTIEEIDTVSDNQFSRHVAREAWEAIDEPDELKVKARGHVRLTDKISLDPGETVDTAPEFEDDVALRARTVVKLLQIFDEKFSSLGKGIRYYRSFDFAVVRKGSRLDERYTPKKIAEQSGWNKDDFMYLIDFSDTTNFNYYRAAKTDDEWELVGSFLPADQRTPKEGTQIGVSEYFIDLSESIEDVPYTTLCFPGFALWSADDIEGAHWDFYPDKTGVADNETIVKDQRGLLSVKTIEAADSTADKEDFEANSEQRTYIEWVTAFFRKIKGLRSDVVDHSNKIVTLEEGLAQEVKDRTEADDNIRNDLAKEITDREDGDRELSERITEEAARLDDIDAQLRSDLDAESEARENADTALQGNIDNEAEARQKADEGITTELTAYENANDAAHERLTEDIKKAGEVAGDLSDLEVEGATSIVDAINKEQQRAKDAETVLRADLAEYKDSNDKRSDELEQKLDEEIKRSTDRDEKIELNYAAADEAEKKAREAADDELDERVAANATKIEGLEQNLTDETRFRQEADKEITDALEAEIQARTDADGDFSALKTEGEHTNLVDAINDEIVRAKRTEGRLEDLDTEDKSNLVAAFNEEKGRAENVEAALQNNLTKEEKTRKTKDDELASNIKSLRSDLGTAEAELDKKISDEATRAITKENELSDALAKERERAMGVEGALDDLAQVLRPADNLVDALNKENSRAEKKESDLDAKIDAEIARATTTEGDLSSLAAGLDKSNIVVAINSENSRALDRESVLQTAISNEELRAGAEEKRLQTEISNESTRAQGAEKQNADAIATERDRALAKEDELSKSIQAETGRAKQAEKGLSDEIKRLSDDSSSTIKDLEEKIQAEVDRSTTEDTALSERLDSEEQARAAKDTELDTAIKDEVSRAQLVEQGLQDSKRDIVSDQMSVAYVVSETGLQTYLAYSSSPEPYALARRNITGSVTVPTPVDGNDAANKSYVDDIHQSIKEKNTAQDEALSQETTERKDADTALGTRIDTLNSDLDDKKLNRKGPDTFSGDLTVSGNQTVSESVTIGQDLTVSGNLYVRGTTTEVDVQNVKIEDNLLVLNSMGAMPVTPSGLAVKVNSSTSSNAYGLVYDVTFDTVKLGIGTVDSEGNFTFVDGEGTALTVREDSTQWTQHVLAMWDDTLKGFVHSAFTTEGTTLKTDSPMSLQAEEVTVKSGTEGDVQFNIEGNADVKTMTAQDVQSSNVSAQTVKVETALQSKDGSVSVTMPTEGGQMARVEDVSQIAQELITGAKLVIESI